MLKAFVKFLFFIYFGILLVNSQEIIDCSFNKSLELGLGEWRKFQSNDFPKALALGPDKCEIKFTFSSSDHKLWISPTNAYLPAFSIEDYAPNFHGWNNVNTNKQVYSYLSKSPSVTLTIPTNRDTENWYGFQSIVMVTNTITGCPFSGLTIHLIDPQDIIPLTSTFDVYQSNATTVWFNTTCTWTFTTTADFKFKFIYKFSRFMNDEIFTVAIDDKPAQNITANYQLGEAKEQTFEAGKLTFNYVGPQRSTFYYFYALVTVVKKDDQPQMVNCNETHLELTKGYGNYESCTTPYTQAENTQTRLKVNLFAEACCDTLKFITGNYTKPLFHGDIITIDRHISNYNIGWESDGSIVQGGFKLDKQIIECKNISQTFIVPCNGSSIHINEFDHGYCTGVTAEYTFILEPNRCYNRFSYNLASYTPNDTTVVLDLISNGQVQHFGNSNFNASTGASGSGPMILRFSATKTSDSILSLGNWYWSFETYSEPMNKPITYNLSETTPTLFFSLEELRAGQALVITVDPNANLEMFLTGKELKNLTNFMIFETDDFLNNDSIGKLGNRSLFIYNSSSTLTSKYIRDSSTFTILRVNDGNNYDNAALYFRRILKSPRSSNCTQDVYSALFTSFALTFPQSSIACQHTVLTYGRAPRILSIYSITSDINNSNLKLYGGYYNRTFKYFEDSGSNLVNYRNTRLYGSVFIFEVPPNANVNLYYGIGSSNDISIHQIGYLHQTNLITSPGYGEPSFQVGHAYTTDVNCLLSNCTFALTIISQDVSSSATFSLSAEGYPNTVDLKTIDLNVTQFYDTSKFTVSYNEPYSSNFLIQYQLTSVIGPTEITTTSIPGTSDTTPRSNEAVKTTGALILLCTILLSFLI